MDVYQIKSNTGLQIQDRHSFVDIVMVVKSGDICHLNKKHSYMYFERLTIKKLISDISLSKNHGNFTLKSLALYPVAYPTLYKATYIFI